MRHLFGYWAGSLVVLATLGSCAREDGTAGLYFFGLFFNVVFLFFFNRSGLFYTLAKCQEHAVLCWFGFFFFKLSNPQCAVQLTSK